VLKEKKECTYPNKSVRVSAPARLHLGFLDLNGSSGRKYGSIGLAIEAFNTSVTVNLGRSLQITSSNHHSKIEEIVAHFYATLGKHIPPSERNVNLTITEQIPEHAGFGSGTQLALTIGTALCKLHNIQAETNEIGKRLGRGSRSGIGIATFNIGGFIIDGGLDTESTTPPVLAHYLFPDDWRIVLIMDNKNQGVHGHNELNAFNNLPPFPLNDAQAICHLTLMQLMPALIEEKIDTFGQAITDIQALIGDYFSSQQGGRYTSSSVAQLLKVAQNLGHKGIAQSSWGPTGCVFVDSDDQAQQLLLELTDYLKQEKLSDISISITKANSMGASIDITST